MGTFGLLLAIVLLMYMVYKGFHLFPTTIFVSLIVLVTSSADLWTGLSTNYASSFGGFAATYGFVLLFGALFGQIMAETGCAKAISNKIISLAGLKHIILITTLVTSLLAYGGLATFVIIFTVYPITKGLYEKAKLPQALNCAAIGLGAGTYTMTALPYSPSVQNIIPTTILGTDIAAAPLMGIVCTVILFGLGYAYLYGMRFKKILATNPEAMEAVLSNRKIELDSEELPHWALALLPLVLVIGTVVATKNMFESSSASVVLALALGIISASLMGLRMKKWDFMKCLSTGSTNGGNAIVCAAAVIGFAGVVRSVPVFQNIVQSLLAMDINPYIKEAVSVNVIAGVVGSATGGVQIFMETLGQTFLDMGLNPEAVHRVATISSGGLDSLPHCSSVVIMLSVMGLTHKEAYKDFGVVTVVIPLIATVVAVLMAITLY